MKRLTLTALAASLSITLSANSCATQQRIYLASDPVDDGPDIVAYSREAINDIDFTYKNITGKGGPEFGRCLHGYVGGNTVFVRSTSPGGVHQDSTGAYMAWPDSIYFSCDRGDDYVGKGHSHPPASWDNCTPSAGDMITFLSDDRADITAIFCDKEKILTVFRPPNEDSVLAHMRTLPKTAPVYLVNP